MTPVLLSFGSNLGNRVLNLRRAAELLRLRGVRLLRMSSLYETVPMDCQTGDPLFLNLVALGLTAHRPEGLLETLLAIESSLGRARQRRNQPRLIDLDLILFGSEKHFSAKLTVPHPRFRQREFVLAGLRELVPGWFDSARRTRIGTLRGKGEVRRVGTLYLPEV